MTNWPLVPLGEIVSFYSGGTPSKSVDSYWSGDVPWFSARDMKVSRLHESTLHVSGAVFSRRALRLLPAGTIVMVVRGMILAHTVPIGILAVDAAINQDLKALIPKREVHVPFLAAMLRAQHSTILGLVSTAAHGTKKLDSRVLEELLVPLPPIADQRRIAAILDHAETLRVWSSAAIPHLDALKEASFRKMFGDVHPNREDLVRLGEVVPVIENGRSPVCESRPRTGDEFGVLKLGAVTYGDYRAGENKAYLGARQASDRAVEPGDVLMTRKNTKDLVGAVALVRETPERLLLPDLIFRLRFDSLRVNGAYLQQALMAPRMRDAVRGLASGSAASMPNISKARLSELKIPIPPLADQEAFDRAGVQIEKQRQRGVSRDAELDRLFMSLQARAFRGEL